MAAELSVKEAEYINKALSNITPQKIRNWFQETLELLGENVSVLKDPSRIFNMDETAFFLNPKGNCVIAEKGKHCYGVSSNNDKENVTTLITVNALDFAPSLTIFKFDRLPASYTKVAPPGWGLGKSKNSWMTSETFFEYFTNVFYPYLLGKQYKLPVIIFLDGHSSHLSPQFFALNIKLLLYAFIPTPHIYSTHSMWLYSIL
ncbi:hypothetical protein NQ314_009396 [Rhamnusium bicolor]|uniref:DDE-1 domain-containing protein n=1 Tax=Rhamnusium bicolor TaxID=1586634 RepID=A0AAV8Y1J9_9CUCU|nr:hypothetical protein NQ314_009396 [Rhamnusium bicolor]